MGSNHEKNGGQKSRDTLPNTSFADLNLANLYPVLAKRFANKDLKCTEAQD